MSDLDAAEAFAHVPGGTLRIRVRGPEEATRLLMLHGGPGMSDTYLDGLIDEFVDGYRVATYAQRGVAPSTAGGPYGLALQAEDVIAVLDALGWDDAVVLGHSWGGYLLLHVLAAHPDRLRAAVALEPIGAVGDGGTAAFGAELLGRLPSASLERLERPDLAAAEQLELIWPGYFAPGSTVPAVPAGTTLDVEVMEAGQTEMSTERGLDGRLRDGRVPTLFLVGDGSPVPATASTDTAAVIGSSAIVVALTGGHFPWLVDRGAVRSAVDGFLQG